PLLRLLRVLQAHAHAHSLPYLADSNVRTPPRGFPRRDNSCHSAARLFPSLRPILDSAFPDCKECLDSHTPGTTGSAGWISSVRLQLAESPSDRSYRCTQRQGCCTPARCPGS